jgi:hypothetical protein
MGEEVVEGGPFTRRDPATGNQSCLDLFIVSRELRPFVKKLKINSERIFTPARVVKERGVPRRVYSDHFSALLTLTDLPRGRNAATIRRKAWNLKKDGGWNRYELLTDQYSEKIEDIVENKAWSVDEAMRKFEKVHDKIKFKAFGKVTLGTPERMD